MPWLMMVALVWIGAVGRSHAAAGAPPENAFVRITEEQGLSHGNVRAITQDRQGFLWMGTAQGGLNRYDGYEVKQFTHDGEKPASIASNLVWCLLTDREGTLWVGTGSGLDRFDRRTETFTHFRPEAGRPGTLPNANVLSLCEDSEGTLWVGTRGGLARLDRETGLFESFVRAPTIPGSDNANSIRCITEDRSTGLLWLGSSDGLAAFDRRTKTFASFIHDPDDPASLCRNPVNAVVIDPEEVFWVLTDGGLNYFVPTFRNLPADGVPPPRQTFQRMRYEEDDPQTIAGEYLRGGLIDRKGRLWVASNSGLSMVDRATRRVTRYRHIPGVPTSLTEDFTYAVFEDRAANLWVSTVSSGVCRMRNERKPFRILQRHPAEPNSLSDNRVTALTFDAAGRLWIGTTAGVNYLENGRWRRPDVAGGTAGSDVRALAALPNGEVWIGTREQGAVRFDGRQFHTYLSPQGSAPAAARELPHSGHDVNDFAYDRHGRLWIGARAYGLDYFDGEKFVHFAPLAPGNPPRRRPTAFPALGQLDERGRFWFATELNGLVCLDPERDELRTFLPNPERPDAFENRGLNFVTADGEGGLWIGGSAGLFRFDRVTETFTQRYTRQDGLPSDTVVSLQADLNGRLWLGTSRGLCRLDPKSRKVRNYDRSDGLPANLFAVRAATRDAAGRLYFGTAAGAVSFHPDELRDDPTPPPVALTEFRVLDQVVEAGGAGSPLREAVSVAEAVRLAPGQAIFSIGFAALDFTAPEKNAYRFRMEGFDPDWRVAAPGARQASYTNLPPGEYTFRVKAANGDGVWNEVGAALRVVVLPPWWSRLWFRAVGLLAGVALLFAAVAWRERAIRRRNAWLEAQVATRTEQLRAEVAVREKAEAALRESHSELETRVQERTAELGRVNENLRGEIAERQKIEAQLRQAQKMEAFGQLAGGVAHDFNNLLTVIIGQCEVLGDAGVAAIERQDALRDIAAAARSASNLTRQLLVFSRRQAMNPTALDFNEVVTGVSKLLRRVIGENIELETLLSSEPLPVNADAAMLEQVLVNMAVNARDAMPRGGRLTIGVKSCVVASQQAAAHGVKEPSAFICCSVADNGVGIPPDVLPRIFEPFFTTKEAGRGTGLGLATSLGIVQQHGGWIEVSTRPGAGTVFRIYLPSREGVRSADMPIERPGFAKASATVLLVEDQDPVRQVTARILGRQGYRVLEAANAEAALALWRGQRDEIALVVTDIVMPGERNGRDLAAALRAEAPQLPIVVITGYDPAHVGGLERAGQPWNAHLRKPFTRDQLLVTLEKLLVPQQ
ncbi:MAG: two-component regulator propeller domain-containing protein [Opitutaceae bacterium]